MLVFLWYRHLSAASLFKIKKPRICSVCVLQIPVLNISIGYLLFSFVLRKFYYEFIKRKGNCLLHKLHFGFGISSLVLEHVKATHVQLYTSAFTFFHCSKLIFDSLLKCPLVLFLKFSLVKFQLTDFHETVRKEVCILNILSSILFLS